MAAVQHQVGSAMTLPFPPLDPNSSIPFDEMPQRIPYLINRLQVLWQINPRLQLAQIVASVVQTDIPSATIIDVSLYDDTKMINGIEKMASQLSPPPTPPPS